MSTKRKIIRFIDRAIDKVLSVLLLIVLGLGIYFIYDSYFTFNASAMESTEKYLSADEIRDGYSEAIAWITIDQTSISYPLTQGKSNSQYLNRSANGEYSLSGSIFLDARNNPAFTDPYSVTYGHHMSGGYMFGALDEFEEKKYFEDHPTGQLQVLAGDEKYRLDVFAYCETDASVNVVFEFEGNNDTLMNYIRSAKVQYKEPKNEDRILALTTCKSPLSTERMALFCTVSEWTKEDDARVKALEDGPTFAKARARMIYLCDKNL